ncbi:hypothetical protein JCM10213_001992 [Rhodosporidiobolus nylandii]
MASAPSPSPYDANDVRPAAVSHDLEQQAHRPHPHPHSPGHHSEQHLQETAVLWDDKLKRWRSHESEEADLEGMSGAGEPVQREKPEVEGSESERTAVGPSPALSVEDEAKGGKKAKMQRAERVPTRMTVEGEPGREVIWLEFAENDPDNPFNWSQRKKWQTAIIACIFTLLVAYAGTSFAMGTASMMRDLGCSREVATLGLSLFPLGFGLGPLFTAPLSEAYGRYPIYFGSCLIYLIFFIPTAYGQNIQTVIISRFIAGIAASTGSTLAAGSIADLFLTHERGLPMSFFTVAAFGGTGLGPAVSGYVELAGENGGWGGWRWIQWLQMIFAGVLAVLVIFFTSETRGSVILSRRARKLRKQTGDQRYQCRSDAERASLMVLFKVSMTRPLYLLGTEAIVFSFSLWVGFAWGCLYLLVEAIPLIFGNVYGFNIGEVGLTFYSVVIASFIGFGTSFLQDSLYRKHVAKRGPEARLLTSLVGALVFPAGALILAFSQGRGHWMGPCIGLVLVFSGVYTIYLAVFSYLADTYTIYASSALSGQSLCRNLCACGFPLFTTYMYQGLGYQWASFLAGMVGLALAAVPWILYFKGPSIRARSNFAKELARIQAEQEK